VQEQFWGEEVVVGEGVIAGEKEGQVVGEVLLLLLFSKAS